MAGSPAFGGRRENLPAAPSRCLPMRRCGRKKGMLMVESTGCAAFGHPAATQGFALRPPSGGDLGGRSDPYVPHSAWRRRAIKADVLVEHDWCRLRLVPRGYLLQRFAGSSCELFATELFATTAVSREKLRSRLRAAALSRAEGHVTTGHASTGHVTTARREPNPSQQHRVAERRHEPRLRVPRKLGCARWNSFACCKGPSIQPQSGRFLVAPFRIAREATTGGRVPACHHEIRQCPTKC
ncbi:MAG: hypothetical protein QOK41_1312 [Sphingomonadales bacterium]|nr:hypothetical protein [Sphingomonadales bacterium]